MLSDDYMSEAAKPLWGPRGRDDLGTMQRLGANAVRMYGNDPREDHRAFLQAADAAGLNVTAGQSDWPFTQMPGNCLHHSDMNCYSQVKESYLGNLKRGFLREDGSYDLGLSYVIVVNEPDLKLPGITEPRKFCRAVISAVDGIADAEREMNVTGRLVNLTVAFSFAICQNCKQPTVGGQKPGLGQMLELRNAFLHPEEYGYSPRNDLAVLYAERFVNCFNTANPARELRNLFFDAYEENFPSMPVVIGEYHPAHKAFLSALTDLQQVLGIVDSLPTLLGIFFFEFQVRYDKGGPEMDFGMFGLGDYEVTTMDFFSNTYPVWCLKPRKDQWNLWKMLPAELEEAYGGEGVDFGQLCVPDPHKVLLSQSGFEEIRKQGDAQRMSIFVSRVVAHYGGEVRDQAALLDFASGVTSFRSLLAGVASRPGWASWDPDAACVADRRSNVPAVGLAAEQACRDATWFDCSRVPAKCQESVWVRADYVFSVYHNQVALGSKGGGPLSTCYFDGAAIFARSAVYRSEDTSCVVTLNPKTTTLTDEGMQAIITQNKSALTAEFIQRVIRERFPQAKVADIAQLQALAEDPPSSMYELLRLLRAAEWVCAGDTGRPCPATARAQRPVPSSPRPKLWWRKWAFLFLGGVVLCSVFVTCIWVRLPKRWRTSLERLPEDPRKALDGGSSGGSSGSEGDSDGGL